MSVQRADPKDVESILFVINKSNGEAYRDVIPPEHFRDPVLTLDGLLEVLEHMTFYTYKLEGEVVGVAALKFESKEVGAVRWVHVLPEHRRKGIGTALMNHLESEAKKKRLKRLRVLYVHDKAYWAKNFYKKLGYRAADKVALP